MNSINEIVQIKKLMYANRGGNASVLENIILDISFPACRVTGLD